MVKHALHADGGTGSKDDGLYIEKYEPAIRFRKRMDGRYKKFKERKETVMDLVENAEHNRISLSIAQLN